MENEVSNLKKNHNLSITFIFISAALKGLPDFIGAPYEFWVGANAEIGTSVGQMRITDFPDKGKAIYDLLHDYADGGNI